MDTPTHYVSCSCSFGSYSQAQTNQEQVEGRRLRKSAILLALLLLLSLALVAFPNVETVVDGAPWVPPELPPDFRPGEENWVEVTRFDKESVSSTWWGDPSGNTDYFMVDHVEWRVRWEYTPHPAVPQYASLYVEVYEKKEDVIWRDVIIQEGESVLIDVIREYGMAETSGVSYIHNQTGRFYMFISGSNIEDFTVTVEQDTDSIPEFPSWTPLLITIVAIVSVTVIYRRKLSQRRDER